MVAAVPYRAPPVLRYTNRPVVASQAAQRTLSELRMFTSASRIGSSVDLATEACAAACTIRAGANLAIVSRACRALRSISINSTSGGMFAGEPVLRSSSTITRSPAAWNRSTMCEPMKPAPPVTMTGRLELSVTPATVAAASGTHGGEEVGACGAHLDSIRPCRTQLAGWRDLEPRCLRHAVAIADIRRGNCRPRDPYAHGT